MTDQRLLIVTPVRNEAAHIERVVRAVAAQTRTPDRWVIVDDGSTDATPQILRRLEGEVEFMEVIATPRGFTAEASDRLAVAAEARAFNYGLRGLDRDAFSYIGKIDGDVVLRPDYFETILAEFDRDPVLGIGGGLILEERGGEWRPTSSAPEHVRGALKLYRRECFEAIGGVIERLGWDGVDETLARMRGFATASFEGAVALHYRHAGSADGRLRGWARWGQTHWMLHHGLLWTAVRAAKVAQAKPRGLSGLAYLFGYFRAAWRRVPRVEIDGYRGFVRAEQRRRLARGLRIRSA